MAFLICLLKARYNGYPNEIRAQIKAEMTKSSKNMSGPRNVFAILFPKGGLAKNKEQKNT